MTMCIIECAAFNDLNDLVRNDPQSRFLPGKYLSSILLLGPTQRAQSVCTLCCVYRLLPTADLVNFLAPSSRYLAILAACVRASHLYGAGEYIDKVAREREFTAVL